MCSANAVKRAAAFHQLITINGSTIFDTTLMEVSLNPALPADAFTVADCSARQCGAPAHVGKMGWQWILKQMDNGFDLDSGACCTDDGPQIHT